MRVWERRGRKVEVVFEDPCRGRRGPERPKRGNHLWSPTHTEEPCGVLLSIGVQWRATTVRKQLLEIRGSTF